MKLLVHFLRIVVYSVGITPPKPEDEKRYALILLALLVAMTAGMIVLTRIILGAVFSSGLR